MAEVSPIILILGSGPNVGQHVAKAFAAKGYKIVLASRSVKEKDSSTDHIHIPTDLSNSDSVVSVFSKVKEMLGYPSVVIYNAGAATPNDVKDPLSLPLASFTQDFTINTTSAFVAAQQAVLGFKNLPDSASRTFIYTGNSTNITPIGPLLTLGVGKSATAHIIHSAATAYADQGFKFYYGDERKADGSPAYLDIDGEAHGKFYLQLSEDSSQGPWQQTFVKGVGYKQF